MLTIQERSCKTSATRFLTVLHKKHDKCKCKTRPLGHSKGGRKIPTLQLIPGLKAHILFGPEVRTFTLSAPVRSVLNMPY